MSGSPAGAARRAAQSAAQGAFRAYGRGMPSPDIVIWGVIAILAVLLWPLRQLMRRRYRRDEEDREAGRDRAEGGDRAEGDDG